MFDKLYELTKANEDLHDLPLFGFGLFINTYEDILAHKKILDIECIDGTADLIFNDEDLKEYLQENDIDIKEFEDSLPSLEREIFHGDEE